MSGGAGRMRHRVVISQCNDVPVGMPSFGLTTELSDSVPCWGELLPIGRIAFQAGQQVGDAATHRLTVRWQERLTRLGTDYQVVHGTERYRVTRCTPRDGRREWIDLELEQLQ